MKEKCKITSSMEDYLEAILVLKEKNRVARVKDIAKELDVRTPSVNAALKTLVKAGFVAHEKYGYVELTVTGEKIARDVKNRHELLVCFLTDILMLDEDTAALDACKIEHEMSKQTFKRLAEFIEYLKHGGKAGAEVECLKNFKDGLN